MTRRRLQYAEAASELGVEESWLRRHIKRLPHSKVGRVVYFTDADLARIDELHHHEPSVRPLAATSAPSASTSTHPLAHLRPLPSRRGSLKTAS
ncbi:helix-turn-helix domain-containing protein [Streptomyces sp. GbtcB6]|uniref:helix-turn-helix domain-containing protein n=1 Tax=Streptomyces sp. GbtcB6 TaxID=2824751 RepID=UPI001C311429|nr:helix-turn-helix domain-containing protein [Streptomyces sp. GbtcB6]